MRGMGAVLVKWGDRLLAYPAISPEFRYNIYRCVKVCYTRTSALGRDKVGVVFTSQPLFVPLITFWKGGEGFGSCGFAT